MPKSKPSVIVTGPASRLPRQLGTFAASPAPVEPIRPKTVPKHRQIMPSSRVKITKPK